MLSGFDLNFEITVQHTWKKKCKDVYMPFLSFRRHVCPNPTRDIMSTRIHTTVLGVALCFGCCRVIFFKYVSSSGYRYNAKALIILFSFCKTTALSKKQENPEAYLPAFGGFCSFGIAAETVWNRDNLGPFADPSKWKIMPDGTLRVFRR